MFTQEFGRYVSEDDSITCRVGNFDCVAFVKRDDCSDAPDERVDGFWPSLNPKDAGYIGAKSKSTLRRHMAKAKQVMEAWQRDEWDYCGVCVVISKNGIELTDRFAHALWGIERNYPGSDNDYLRVVANELLEEALEDAKAKLAKLCE